MHRLTHFRLCPRSRAIRLVLGELGLEPELVEERPWEWRQGFLAINPSGELPVLELDGGVVLCGAYAISEFIAEEVQRPPAGERVVPLLPGNREERAEVRRLADWFLHKLDREVTRELLAEKAIPIIRGSARPPDLEALRAIRSNLRYHLSYVEFLAESRNWLAGEELSLADLAAAAHLSIIDYLGEVVWDDHPGARTWYSRIKSRRSFRPLLADRMPGLAPPLHYTNLDF